MNQSRKMSFVETCTNIFIGWCVAMILQLVVFPLYSIEIPLSANFEISIIFTIAAIFRQYMIRRFFNSKIHSFAEFLSAFFDRITLSAARIFTNIPNK